MSARHWGDVSNELSADIVADKKLTLTRLVKVGIMDASEAVADIAQVASKECMIESALDKMEEVWKEQAGRRCQSKECRCEKFQGDALNHQVLKAQARVKDRKKG